MSTIDTSEYRGAYAPTGTATEFIRRAVVVTSITAGSVAGAGLAPDPAFAGFAATRAVKTQAAVTYRGTATTPVLPEPAMAVEYVTSLVPAMDTIREYTRLPIGWDDEGGVPPTAEAVATADGLITAVAERIRLLDGATLAPTDSSPISDGGLLVEWSGASVRVDAVVGPDGSLSYLFKHGSGPNAQYREEHAVSRSTLVAVIANAIATR